MSTEPLPRKVRDDDAKYLENRKRFSERAGERELWSIMDQWPLYCGVKNLARTLAVNDLVRTSLSTPGHIAEFGSWKGANLVYMAKLLKIYAPQAAKLVHCFDSFEGLTEFAEEDGKANELGGKYKGSFEELLEVIRLYDLEDDIRIHKGLIEETLPPLLKKEKALSFSLVYIDTDLFSSTQLILRSLHPRLVKGGAFVLDEWNDPMYPGEGVAANEFLNEYSEYYQAEALPHTRQPNMVLRRIK